MFHSRQDDRARSACQLASWVLVAAISCFAAPSHAFAISHDPVLGSCPQTMDPCLALAPVASDWWQQIYGPIETALNSRTRMVQFGAVAMCIALFVIWYRR